MRKINKRPVVSVIMPVYNAGEFLVESIESILSQTYKNFELIIVDDGSTDNSWQLIKKYKAKYPNKLKIFHLENRINYAGNGAVNHGLRYAGGEFIVRMDSDDISYPMRLERQVDHMLKNPNVILLGTQAKLIDKNGKVFGLKTLPTEHNEIYQAYGMVHPIVHPSCMIRRSLLPDPNKIYDDKYGVNSDYYTFFRFLNRGRFANLDEYLLKYRIHENNFSLQKPKKVLVNTIKIRLDAYHNLNYKFTLQAWAVMAVQSVLVILLPEKFLIPLNLTLRGMINPLRSAKSLISSIL